MMWQRRFIRGIYSEEIEINETPLWPSGVPSLIEGKRTGTVEYSYIGGEAYDRRCMAAAEQSAVFSAAFSGELSKTLDSGGGTALPGAVCRRGY